MRPKQTAETVLLREVPLSGTAVLLATRHEPARAVADSVARLEDGRIVEPASL